MAERLKLGRLALGREHVVQSTRRELSWEAASGALAVQPGRAGWHHFSMAKRGQSEIVSTEAYWDAQDATYATEVFVVWKECTNGSLDAALDAAAQTRRSAETIAVDFGTGPGFALRGLSERFEWCVGVDLSPALVKTANVTAKEQGLDNTVAIVSDLSKGRSIAPAVKRACKGCVAGSKAGAGPRVSFGVCANVLLSPCASTRRAIIKTVASTLEVGGSCLFVVPSLESRMWVEHLFRLWDKVGALDEGLAGDGGRFPSAQKKRKRDSASETMRSRMDLHDLLNGVLPAGETPTQHYLKEQLVAELGQAGLSVRSIEKVEFSMKTEFPEPPKWMGEERIGLPWDWMAVAEKTSPM